MDMIIALPKGVVLDRSLDLATRLRGCQPEPKKLRITCSNGVQIMLVKHRDIPKLVEDDLVDIGITSTDWLEEKRVSVAPFFQLDWCHSRISLIGREDVAKDLGSIGRPSICATEFPVISAAYLADTRRTDRVTLLHVAGSTEAYVGAICDFAIDCVETGETLRQNGLVELEVIRNISTVAVASRRGSRFVSEFKRMLRDCN